MLLKDDGLSTLIQYVLRGGLLTKKSWLASLTCPFYLSALASLLAAHPNKKVPHIVRDLLIVPFAGLSSNNISDDLILISASF